ncbi:MAG: DNA alkylation repair protein [Pseudomarimonas sp.]
MPAKSAAVRKPASNKAAASKMSLSEAMAALEAAGSEQTRKTYTRHRVTQPMFGVSFATLQTLRKKIKVDHELALALWQTNNFDARNLAVKVVDPQRMSEAQLDAWASEPSAAMCCSYVAQIAAEGPYGQRCVERWLVASNEPQRCVGWTLVGALAMSDESIAETWFVERLRDIESGIHSAPNGQRDVMNRTLISIGCRSAALRVAAIAAAQRIGVVEIDHGDTACKTPDAASYIEKAWTHSESKGFDSPAAQERKRESMRLRC